MASLVITLLGSMLTVVVATISTPSLNMSFFSSVTIYPPCLQTSGALTKWSYESASATTFYCAPGPSQPWSMLNAYRSGGKLNRHWKYTDNGDESGCLQNWKYYASDGEQLYAVVNGKSTTMRDTRPWCALAVYRRGGKQSKQWDICHCDANGGVLHG